MSEDSILDNVPNEILFEMFTFNSIKTLVATSHVCKKWNELASNDKLWENLSYLGKKLGGNNGRKKYMDIKLKEFLEKIRVKKLLDDLTVESQKKLPVLPYVILYYSTPILCLVGLFLSLTISSIALSFHNEWYMYLAAFLVLILIGLGGYGSLIFVFIRQRLKWIRLAKEIYVVERKYPRTFTRETKYTQQGKVRLYYFAPVSCVMVSFLSIFLVLGGFFFKGMVGFRISTQICFTPMYIWTAVYLALTIYVFYYASKVERWAKKAKGINVSTLGRQLTYYEANAWDFWDAFSFPVSFAVVFNSLFIYASLQLFLLGLHFDFGFMTIWVTFIPSWIFLGFLVLLILPIVGVFILLLMINDKVSYNEKHCCYPCWVKVDKAWNDFCDWIKINIFREDLRNYDGLYEFCQGFWGLMCVSFAVLSVMCIPMVIFTILMACFVHFALTKLFIICFVGYLIFTLICCVLLPLFSGIYVVRNTRDMKVIKSTTRIPRRPYPYHNIQPTPPPQRMNPPEIELMPDWPPPPPPPPVNNTASSKSDSRDPGLDTFIEKHVAKVKKDLSVDVGSVKSNLVKRLEKTKDSVVKKPDISIAKENSKEEEIEIKEVEVEEDLDSEKKGGEDDEPKDGNKE